MIDEIDAFEQAIEDTGRPDAAPGSLDVMQAAAAAIAWHREHGIAATAADIANMASMILQQQEARLIRRQLEEISGRLRDICAAIQESKL